MKHAARSTPGAWTLCAVVVCGCALRTFPGAPDAAAIPDAITPPDVASPPDVAASPDVLPCPAPQERCGGACVDTRSDLAHCGACGNACSSGQVCAAGRCVLLCPAGQSACGTTCHSLATDAAHCGSCANACAAGQPCVGGACMGGAALTQRSCAGTPTPAGCGMVLLTGGSFTMGSNIDCSTMSGDPACVHNGSPAQTNVTVGTFAIDAYEVTVARFNAYWAVRARDMAAVRGAPIRYPRESIAWQPPPNPEPVRQNFGYNWSAPPSVRDAHPMNGVDYWMAQEFCVWDGSRLPTEAEWEYAARGSARAGLAAGRVYPWGDQDPGDACERARWNTAACQGDDGGSTRRVGSFPAGAAGGVFDLAGNVDEWTADTFVPFVTSGASAPCGDRSGRSDVLCDNDPVGARVVRGGSWDGTGGAPYLRAATRIRFTPAGRYVGLGFRCARSTP